VDPNEDGTTDITWTSGRIDYLRDHMEVRIALVILVAKVVNGMTGIIN